MWLLEFTASGQPHLHLLLFDTIDLAILEALVANAWERVVGTASRVHVALAENPIAALYYLGKRDGKFVPTGFTHPGRWWGTWHIVRSPPRVITLEGNPLVVLTPVADGIAELENTQPDFSAKAWTWLGNVLEGKSRQGITLFGTPAYEAVRKALEANDDLGE